MNARYSLVEPDDFEAPLQKVMAILSNWELIDEQKLQNACAALQIIAQGRCYRSIGVYNHYRNLVYLFLSKNIPLMVQHVAMETVSNIIKDIQYRREVAKLS